MKTILYSGIIALFIQFNLHLPAISQIFTPVEWNYNAALIGENLYMLTFTADIESGWYVYSQNIADGGPVPTTFTFDGNPNVEMIGTTEEAGTKTKEDYDKLFQMKIKKFGSQAIFHQKVKITQPTKLSGFFTYMTCDDSKCLPPEDVNFEFDLVLKKPEKKPAENIPTDGKVEKKSIETEQTIPEAPQSLKKEKSKSTPKSGFGDLSSGMGSSSLSVGGNDDNSGGFVDPVSWSLKTTEASGGTTQLQFIASINDGWYVYSQTVPKDGPVATTFTFNENENVELIGEMIESGEKVNEGFDKLFNMNIKKFSGEATFTREVNIKNTTEPLTGYFEFMTCNDAECLPPKYIDFRINLKDLTYEMGENLLISEELTEQSSESGNPYVIQSIDFDNPVAACGDVSIKESSGLMKIFMLGLIGGLIALLTPCVFPMIPLTVSFFTKSSSDKRKGILNAILYGGFILLIYVLLSIPFHLMDSINPDILNDISTNVVLNVVFFAIFVVFAFSFFGFYEISMPSSFTNRVDSASDIGGIIGTFFMALTLSLVSFSCTGPILGSLLAGALTSNGGAIQLTVGMAGFGLALALPFALFAAFPGWLNSLPKSGGWLNTVKVVLGFIELGLAFKFLSNADLVKHWGLLKIEVFLVIWLIVAIGLALYLFGKIKFPHDSPLKKLSFIRLSSGVLAVAFVFYLGSGFLVNKETNTFTSLKLLSGLAPPVGYSWFLPNDCPQSLNCFKDYDEGLAYAKKHNKPIMIDFTGHACVNCRKMEELVWPDKDIYKRLNNDFVLISLYVDDKQDLPEIEKIEYEEMIDGTLHKKTRINRTVGNKWAFFQSTNFKNNSQPWYVLLTPDEELLSHPVGYTPDKDEYLQFLECGFNAFEEMNGLAEKK